MVLIPAALDPVEPQVLHPRLAELWLIRCQTSLNSLIYGANFGNYVRVTDSLPRFSSGKQLGRPRVNIDVREIRQLRSDGMSLRAIASQVGISHTRVAQLLQSSS